MSIVYLNLFNVYIFYILYYNILYFKDHSIFNKFHTSFDIKLFITSSIDLKFWCTTGLFTKVCIKVTRFARSTTGQAYPNLQLAKIRSRKTRESSGNSGSPRSKSPSLANFLWQDVIKESSKFSVNSRDC